MKTRIENAQIKYERTDLSKRTIEYSRQIIRMVRELESGSIGRLLGKQLLSAGTSVGANFHESQAAQTKADFIAKVSIAFREAREAAYWLEVIRAEELVSSVMIHDLIDETDQLSKILSSILLSSKQQQFKSSRV